MSLMGHVTGYHQLVKGDGDGRAKSKVYDQPIAWIVCIVMNQASAEVILHICRKLKNRLDQLIMRVRFKCR